MSAVEIRSLNGHKLKDETARGNIEKLRTESQQYTDTKISQLINSAPTTLDTLGEIAAAMVENATVVEALDVAIGQKADKIYVDEAIAAISMPDISDQITEVLAEAKASGEFDGEDGISATHSWNGTTLTITSASGSSSADLKGADGKSGTNGISPTVSTSKSGKVTTVTIADVNGTKTVTINDGADGAPGAAGSDGKDGAAGKDGTSVTVKSVSESSADGGSNVVTFSDGKTLTVKNGSKGSAGSKGDQGDTGRRGTGLLPITTAPSSYTTTVNGLTPAYRIALSTVKTQASTDEVYAGDTLRYSYYHYPIIYVDASYVYCGTRVSIRGASGAAGATPVKGTDYWTASDKNEITQEVTTELQDDFVKKNQGSSNVGKILVVGADGNLTLTDMPTIMSGDVVGVIDSNNNIVITGDLVDGTYTFKYENTDGTYTDIGSLVVGNGEPEPAYINLADTSAAAGWLNDKRFSTSSPSTETIKDGAGAVITNYIKVNRGQVIRAKGINFVSAVGSITPSVGRYNPKDTFVGLAYLGSAQGGTFDSATATSMCTITNSYNSGDYIRICGSLVSGYTADDVIITLDQEIVD